MPPRVFGTLRSRGLIDDDVAILVLELKQLRNEAVHTPQPDISTADAKEYIDIAERVVEYLRQQRPSLKGLDRNSDHRIERNPDDLGIDAN